jgi:hypothetical protein
MSSTNPNETCSAATLKKIESEVRHVFAIAVRDHGMDPSTADSILELRGYATLIRKKTKKTKKTKKDELPDEKPKVITEDLGKIFEMAICLLYQITFDGKYKYSIEEAEIIKEKIKKLKDVFPFQIEHIAKNGSQYDFGSIDKTTHLSAKTTKKDGKVSPQVIGQPSRKKFCAFFGLEPTCNLDEIKHYIELNVEHLLDHYIQHTFDCPIIYYNKHKDTRKFITMKKKINWTSHTITFSHITKKKKWNESSTITANNVTIGEFQVHNHRDCIKFRWSFEKILDLFSDNFDIIDLT